MVHCAPTIQKYLGITLLPQAGVSLGMSLTAMSLGESGLIIRNIALFAVLIYELVGPLFTKIALDKAERSPKSPSPPETKPNSTPKPQNKKEKKKKQNPRPPSRQQTKKQLTAPANIELHFKFQPNKIGDGAEISTANPAIN